MGRSFGSLAFGSGLWPGYSFDTDIASQGTGPIILVDIAFPSGMIYLASETVRFNTRYYEGRLIGISTYRRALQQNLGIFEIASMELQFSDVNEALTVLSTTTQIKGTTVTCKVGTRRIPLEAFRTFYEGKIDDFGAGEYSFRILCKDRLWTLPENPTTGFINETDFPNALPEHLGRPLPLCYGTHAVTAAEDARDRGGWPTSFVDVTSTERVFLIARHPVKAINEVYGFIDSIGSQELTETTDYVAYPNALLNGEKMAYVKLTASGFAKITDTNGRLGVLTVNVQGREDAGDGTGTVLTNPIDILEDLFDNYLGAPPRNGTKFDEARLVAEERAYVAAGGYLEVQPTDSFLSDLLNSFNIRTYYDKDGLIAVDIFNPPGPGETLSKIKEEWDVLSDSYSIDVLADLQGAEDAQIVNDIDYSTKRHWSRGHMQAADVAQDADSIALYGSKKFTLETPWGDSNSAFDLAQRLIFQFRNPVKNITFTMPLRGLLFDLTDQFDFTHVHGAFTDRQFEIIEHAFDPQGLTVSLRAKDVEAITQNGFFLDDEDARTLQSDGTAAVTNTDATVTLTGATDMTTSGVAVGDTFEFVDPANEANLLCGKVAAPITATTFEAEDTDGNPMTVWTTESSISYKIIKSWLTADAAQQVYGHICDETTEQFSDGDAGKVLL